MAKTKVDLSTLSDITDGTHTVKVKAKADGYIDSEFSNEVNWVKTPQAVNFTLSVGSGSIGSDIPTYIKLGVNPTSSDDYDYEVHGKNPPLYNKAGNVVTTPVTLSANCVYVWGFRVYVNNRGQNLNNYNATYDTAFKIMLSQNDDIIIECKYASN